MSSVRIGLSGGERSRELSKSSAQAKADRVQGEGGEEEYFLTDS
jgi:hypothetical protein